MGSSWHSTALGWPRTGGTRRLCCCCRVKRIAAVLGDSHRGSSLSPAAPAVRGLCSAVTDRHKPFQVCHVLKHFPSFPPSPIAPCPPALMEHELLLLHCSLYIQQLQAWVIFLHWDL